MEEGLIQDAIVSAIGKLEEDYMNNNLCHEGTFESALYRHLMFLLGDKLSSNTKIWCQLKLRKDNNSLVSVDMGIVDIDASADCHLKDSITKIHALIEIKYTRVSKKLFNALKSLKKSARLNINGKLSNDPKRLFELKENCFLMKDKLHDNDKGIIVNNVYYIVCYEAMVSKDNLNTGFLLSENDIVVYNEFI